MSDDWDTDVMYVSLHKEKPTEEDTHEVGYSGYARAPVRPAPCRTRLQRAVRYLLWRLWNWQPYELRLRKLEER